MAAHELPEELSIQRYYTTIHGGNFVTVHKPYGKKLHFLLIPSATSQKPVKWWTIPPLSFRFEEFAVYPTDSILAVAEEKGR